MQADLSVTETTTATEATPRPRSASLAAVLSFVWPGLGQLYRGRRWTGVSHAVPPALVVIGVLLVAAGGLEQLAFRLLTPAVGLGATALVAGLALWRIVSIFDARRRIRAPTPDAHPRRSLAVAALLSLVVVATHAFAGYYTYSFFRAGEQIYEPITGAPPEPSPSPSIEPGPPVTPEPGATAPPTQPPPTEMVNVLFVGIDRGTTRLNTNTDTLLLASFDPRTGRIVMISIPRDTAQVPLYNGRTWPRKINALYHYAEAHPAEFPAGGMGTLVREVEYLIGVPVDYYASIEMAGFWGMIDKVGGVDVYLEEAVIDPVYHLHEDRRGFEMQPGWHHLDGRTALAFVRSRHGPNNSDYERARRQQQVLLALRERLRDPAVLLNLPTLLDYAAQMVRTDVPLDRMPEFIELVQATQGAEVRNVVLGPRRFAEVIPNTEFAGFGTRLKMEEVALLSLELFGNESRYAQPGAMPTVRPDATRDPGSTREPGSGARPGAGEEPDTTAEPVPSEPRR